MFSIQSEKSMSLIHIFKILKKCTLSLALDSMTMLCSYGYACFDFVPKLFRTQNFEGPRVRVLSMSIYMAPFLQYYSIVIKYSNLLRNPEGPHFAKFGYLFEIYGWQSSESRRDKMLCDFMKRD